MNRSRTLSACLCLLFLLVSCGEKEPEVYGSIELSKTEIEFSAKESEAQTYLKISSSYQWEAAMDVPWLSMSIVRGEAGKEYRTIVSAKANALQEARVGTITISSGAAEKKIVVTQSRGVLTISKADVEDLDRIYIPKEYENQDFFSSEGKWFFGRSAQSEHFIIFWEPGFGEFGETTPSDCQNERYRVDVDELLSWAEACYDCYVGTLKFADKGRTILDNTKIDIWLEYTTEWAAYGSGLEDKVGCLWINPDAARDKSTVAHEIGHSFQYIVGCDLLRNKSVTNVTKAAFRYDIGQGNGFWEQTAQWQAYLMVPSETFTNYNFLEYCKNVHKHLLHEDNRYTNYFIHHYWTDRYGMEAVSDVWKAARSPKDAIQVYQELHGLSVAELNAQIYDYAAHVATWDFKGLSDAGTGYINKFAWNYTREDGVWYKVGANVCPEATGFNIIWLNSVTRGQEVSIEFEGLPNEPGYNSSGNASDAGWTIGFVALGTDKKTRYYSEPAVADMSTDLKTSVKWTVPEDALRVWAVVAATPVNYISHKWDDDNSNDRHWPYRFKVEGASPVNIK